MREKRPWDNRDYGKTKIMRENRDHERAETMGQQRLRIEETMG